MFAKILFALSCATALAAQENVAALEGLWQGTARTLSLELHLAVRIEPVEGGGHRAIVDYLDERLSGLPIENLAVDSDEVRFAQPFLGGRFVGRLKSQHERLTGQWFLRRGRVPLTFVRVEAVTMPARPQEPTGELPYRALDVSFPSGDATLAGTLTLPATAGPHPGAVLIAGSGYQSRDATIRGHRPFFVLADHLTRRGFAVLRYDKRGCAESSGSLAVATTRDLAADAAAALRYLRTRDEVDGKRVGFVGHSEGALIAPMVAGDADAPAVAFMVSIAAPGVCGRLVLTRQLKNIAAKWKLPATDIDALAQLNRRVFDLLEVAEGSKRRARIEAAARRAWPELSPATHAALGGLADNLVARSLAHDTPWMRFIADHDPAEDFARVVCSVLVLTGERDLLIDPEQNLPAIRDALTKATASDVTIVTLPGLNHQLQNCQTGSPAEYFEIEETIAPAALKTITSWMIERTAK